MATSFCITVEAIKDSGERVEIYTNGRWGNEIEGIEEDLANALDKVNEFPEKVEEEVEA